MISETIKRFIFFASGNRLGAKSAGKKTMSWQVCACVCVCGCGRMPHKTYEKICRLNELGSKTDCSSNHEISFHLFICHVVLGVAAPPAMRSPLRTHRFETLLLSNSLLPNEAFCVHLPNPFHPRRRRRQHQKFNFMPNTMQSEPEPFFDDCASRSPPMKSKRSQRTRHKMLLIAQTSGGVCATCQRKHVI